MNITANSVDDTSVNAKQMGQLNHGVLYKMDSTADTFHLVKSSS